MKTKKKKKKNTTFLPYIHVYAIHLDLVELKPKIKNLSFSPF